MLQACHDIGSAPEDWRAPCIPRGDLQTTFLFKGFDEVRRLGLSRDTEAAVRAAISDHKSARGVSTCHTLATMYVH